MLILNFSAQSEFANVFAKRLFSMDQRGTFGW